MNAKPRLRRLLTLWGEADRMCRDCLNEIETMQRFLRQAEALAAMEPESPGRKQTRGELNAIAAKYRETLTQTRQAVDDILAVRKLTEGMVALLNTNQNRVITLRYKRGKSWDAIGVQLSLSTRQVQRIAAGAWEAMEDLLSGYPLEELCKSTVIRIYLGL